MHYDRSAFLLRVSALVLLLAALALPAWAGEPAKTGTPAFHGPASDAEKVLDQVVRLSDRDDGFVPFLLATPGAVAKPAYERQVTRRLMDSLAALEKAAVTENCQGHYIDGDVCGLDYNPLTCAQDGSEHYRYRTVTLGPDAAVIDFAWPGEPKARARFELVRQDGQWKVDAVSCKP